MEHKEAAKILIKMLNKYPFEREEKEAVLAAIGILGWTYLSENRIKARREEPQDKSR